MHLSDDRTAIFEDITCWNCHGVGTIQLYHPCPNDGQTCRKRCEICGATRKGAHQYQPNPQRDRCDTCAGKGIRRENLYDHDTTGVWKTLPFRVYRSERPQTPLEALLGGGLGSITDYGRYKSLTDEQLITSVKNTFRSVQYCRYITPAGNVANGIGILCNDSGYTVIPLFD